MAALPGPAASPRPPGSPASAAQPPWITSTQHSDDGLLTLHSTSPCKEHCAPPCRQCSALLPHQRAIHNKVGCPVLTAERYLKRSTAPTAERA